MRRVGATIAAAALLTATGCGGSDELSASEFRERANGICRDLSAANDKALKDVDTDDRDAMAQATEEVGKRTETALGELEDLEGPESAEEALQRFLDTADQFRAALADRVQAAGDDDRDALAQADAKISKLSEQARQSAEDAGLDACAT